MALSIGIVGLPNAGKSTLFNALTKNDVLAANYPFATIEPNVGVVGVPDHRLGKLAEIFGSERQLPATVQFVDIAGIVRGASEGEGLGNKFLSHIRESDAICQVTRVFRDEDVTHVDGKVSPVRRHRDDLDRAGPRRPADPRERAAAPRQGVPQGQVARAGVRGRQGGPGRARGRQGCVPGRARPRRDPRPAPAERQAPLFVFNCDTDELNDEDLKSRMREIVAPAEAIFLDAKSEAELVELGDDEEAEAMRAEMLADMGVDEPGLDALARVGFDTLGLQTYLTAGPKESRAWTIPKGATAPQAAGVIHTDFERGFIKAEIVSFDDLVAAGTMAAAKSAGKVRMEGKDYVMADGDVVEFRFNV